MLDENHVRELRAKNTSLDINAIQQRLRAIQSLLSSISTKNCSRVQDEVATTCNWPLGVAVCVFHMQRIKHLELYALQLVAIVLYFDEPHPTNANLFFEVLTGEGKTMIIAIVAAVAVLLGRARCVDVITATDLLADANAREMRSFYAALRITCTSNTISSGDTYTAHIVYGSIFHFAKDYLTDQLRMLTSDAVHCCGLHRRPRALCIVDEVDLLAIDHAERLVKVADAFPGMEMLARLHRDVYNMTGRQFDSVLHAFHANFERAYYEEFVPRHLWPYCAHMRDTWVASRKRAMTDKALVYVVDEQEGRVLPIDTQSGMIMRHSAFPDGLQQFLELSHSCVPTCDVLNAITISNCAYMRMYERLCGFSGTLGENVEMELLEKVFGATRCYRIPAYRESRLRLYTPRLNYYSIKYRNLRTGAVDYHAKLPNGEFEFACLAKHSCACMYKNLMATDALIALNQFIAENIVVRANRQEYMRFICDIFDKYKKQNRLLNVINFKDNELRKKYVPGVRFIDDYLDIPKLVSVGNETIFVFDVQLKQTGKNAYREQHHKHLAHYLLDCGRALLIVCEPNRVEKFASEFYKQYISIDSCLNRSKAKHRIIKYVGIKHKGPLCVDEINPIRPGDIIVTTLLGARGTDYRISDELRDNGGLHVVLTFVPANRRHERQVIGRTARNGQPGSAQFFLIESFYSNILQQNPNVDELLAQRDEKAINDLLDIHVHKYPRLLRDDRLHATFRAFIRELRENHIDDNPPLSITIADLTEYWAFWLKLNEHVLTDDVHDDFKHFCAAAEVIIKCTGFFNPVHAARRANWYFARGNHQRAARLLALTVDDAAFCEALIHEYVQFARFAIRTGRAREIAREALRVTNKNDYIDVAKYAHFLNDRDAMMDAIRETIASHSLAEREIAASLKTTTVMVVTGLVALKRKKYLDSWSLITRGVRSYCKRAGDVRLDMRDCGEYLAEMFEENQLASGLALFAYSTTFDKFFNNLKLVLRASMQSSTREDSDDGDYVKRLGENVHNLEMVLAVFIDGIVDAMFGDDMCALPPDELEAIFKDECYVLANLHGNIIDALYVSFMNEQTGKFVRPLFEALHHEKIEMTMNKILTGVQLVCERIRIRMDEFNGEPYEDYYEIGDKMRVLFDCITTRLLEIVQTEVVLTVQRSMEVVRSV